MVANFTPCGGQFYPMNFNNPKQCLLIEIFYFSRFLYLDFILYNTIFHSQVDRIILTMNCNRTFFETFFPWFSLWTLNLLFSENRCGTFFFILNMKNIIIFHMIDIVHIQTYTFLVHENCIFREASKRPILPQGANFTPAYGRAVQIDTFIQKSYWLPTKWDLTCICISKIIQNFRKVQ